MNFKTIAITVLILGTVACSGNSKQDQAWFDEALNNGILANEGYNRCVRFVHDWLNYSDSATGLIPENLSAGRNTWSTHNSAADNYPFMVLTSYLLDKKMYDGQMLAILNTEKKITSRLGALPDNYSFTKQNFLKDEVDTAQIIFGTSEYIKDGLIPLTEYIGQTPWSERMIAMLDDLSKYLVVAENFEGKSMGPSVDTEINGEMLQTLSRVYWMTKDEKYLNWAIKIADYYLLDNPGKILENKRFRLRDHGCEIIGGLSEIYATVNYADKNKKAAYEKSIHQILDRILETGRNEDGMFYNEVNMATGQIVDSNIVDGWGYLYNAYYTLYLVDNQKEYLEAVQKPLQILHQKYRDFNWENNSSDGYADAIESGINLYNRERIPALKDWLDSEIKVMWSLQDSAYRPNAQQWKNSGIIEGWHGDGNFARTTIMYCLWKTNGVTIQPWRRDVMVGSVEKDGTLYISIKSNDDWEGTVLPGTERHKDIFHLPLDYPRINQFPEWFTIKDNENYLLSRDSSSSEIKGEDLKKGLQVTIKKDIPYTIKITRPNAGQ